jgi:hypothetical protein
VGESKTSKKKEILSPDLGSSIWLKTLQRSHKNAADFSDVQGKDAVAYF